MHYYPNGQNSWIKATQYYSENQIIPVLAYAAMDKTSVKDTATDLIHDVAKRYGITPSGDTVLRSIKKLIAPMQREEMEDHIATLLQAMVKTLPEYRIWQKRHKLLWQVKGSNIAIDIHQEEIYTKKHLFDDEGKQLSVLSKNKDKSGKRKKVIQYATASIIWDEKAIRPPLTIAFVLVHKGETHAKVLARIWEQLENMDIKLNLVTLDGGFYSVACCKFLDNQGINRKPQKYLIRANYRSSTDYPGEVGQRFPYTIKENTNDAYLVEAYLISGKSPKGDQTFMFISSRKYQFPVSDVRKL